MKNFFAPPTSSQEQETKLKNQEQKYERTRYHTSITSSGRDTGMAPDQIRLLRSIRLISAIRRDAGWVEMVARTR
jgi:hypothetical protein